MSNPYESSASPFQEVPSGSLQIRSLGILSCAKLMGIMYAILGLIAGGFMTLFAMTGAALGPDGSGPAALGFGAVSIVVIPIAYGIAGFLGGALMAFLYNVVASIAGGIELHTERVR